MAGEAVELNGVESLNAIMIAVLRRRIEQLGIDKSGTYNYYASRAAAGWIFSDYDIAVVKLLIAGDIKTVHEVGAGVGQLAALLGWNGVRVTAFEQERDTYLTAKVLHDVLTAVEPELMANVELIGHAFPLEPGFGFFGNYPVAPDVAVPAAFAARHDLGDAANAVVMSTNLVATLAPEAQERVVAAMRRYRAALIDVDRFFGYSGIVADRARVFDLFRRAGFSRAEPFLDLGRSGCYFLFDGHAIQPSAVSHALDLGAVGTAAVAFLKDWVGQDAAHRKSAGNYYLEKIAAARWTENYDGAVAEYVAAHLAPGTAIYELGSGFGELCYLLALRGFDVTGIESETGRFEGAEALRRRLAAAGLDLPRLKFVKGRFPDLFERARPTSGAMLVATNVTSSYLGENLPRVIEATKKFDHVIVDLGRFGPTDVPRGEELASRLAAAGFVETARIATYDNVDIRHFAATRG